MLWLVGCLDVCVRGWSCVSWVCRRRCCWCVSGVVVVVVAMIVVVVVVVVTFVWIVLYRRLSAAAIEIDCCGCHSSSPKPAPI